MVYHHSSIILKAVMKSSKGIVEPKNTVANSFHYDEQIFQKLWAPILVRIYR